MTRQHQSLSWQTADTWSVLWLGWRCAVSRFSEPLACMTCHLVGTSSPEWCPV